MGVVLWFVSVFISLIICPAGMIYGFFKQVYKRKFFYSFKGMDNKFLLMAIGLDRYGNVVCPELLNDCLITKNSIYLFGNGKETISSVLGKNKRAGTLTKTGKWLCKKLDSLEKDHVTISIDIDIDV